MKFAGTAEISECGRYRWSLTRSWLDLPTSGTVAFVMLNPSTANGLEDDPTIRRCIGFARTWGFSRLLVVNLFALRSTDPTKLLTAENPTGGEAGDSAIRQCASLADLIVAAWGAKVPFGRDKEVERMLLEKRQLHCLGFTKKGAPRHPLYMRGDVQPRRYPI